MSPAAKRLSTGLALIVAVALSACTAAPPATSAPPAPTQAAPAANGAAPAAAAKPAANSGDMKKIRVTQSTADSVSFVSIDIARYFNYFGDEGLAVDVVVTNGGGPDVAALVAGQAQFTAAGPINQLALFQQGQKTLAVAGFSDRLVANLVMRKDVFEAKGLTPSSSLDDRLKALKGLKISVTKVGSLTDMVARSYLARAGLDPTKDAQIIATNAGQPQIAAIEQKEVEVASVTSPAAEVMVDRGVGVMLVSNTLGEDPFFQPFTQQAILVREDYARQNPDTVRAFVRAIVRANQWAHDHSAGEGAEIMHFYVPSLDVADVAKQYAAMKDGIPPTGCMTQKGVEANVKLYQAAGLLKQDIKWSDLATNEFLPTKCDNA